jgi:hypothetical protein
MAFDIWEKIEAIRHQPESVRMRYALACVGISMLLIIGLWLLSVREGFSDFSEGLSATIEKGKEINPQTDTPSLNDMFEQSKTLRVDSSGKTGQQFFDEKLQQSQQGTASGIGTEQ